MRSVTLVQAEAGSKVLLKERSLLDLSKESLVDLLLVSDTLSLDLLLAVVAEELLLSGGALLGLLLTGKVGNVELVEADTLDRDTGRGGNDVASVDSSDRDTVDLEGTRDEEGVVLKRLQVDDALAAESASEDDKNGTRDERGTQLLGARALARGLGSRSLLSGVPLLGLVGSNSALTAVLGLGLVKLINQGFFYRICISRNIKL